MSIQPSPKILTLLLAIALPGGVLLLLFPKQTESLINDVKSRIHRHREATRQQ